MIQEKLQTVLSELNMVLASMNISDGNEAAKYICTAPKIFTAGVGRSGYMMRAFSMRLMHAGFSAYVVGDTEAPGASKDDLLILGSGSGETESLIAVAKKAKKIGLHILLITGFPDSPLGHLADKTIRISAPTPKSQGKSSFISSQPMGSLFEQALLLYLDSLVMEIMDRQRIDVAVMFGRHANLE